MKKRIISALLAVVLVLGCLAGCSSTKEEGGAPAANANSDDVIVIKFPTTQCGVNTAAAVVQELIDQFNEEYAGKYYIEKEEIPGDANYLDKIKVQLSTGDLPPVVYGAGMNVLDLLLEKDMALDLTPYIEADPEWKAMYSESALAVNSRDGKIYASSNENSIIGYFYNKDMFAQAGIEKPAETWEELWEQCEKLKAAGFTPFSLDTIGSAWTTLLWMGAMVATANDDGLAFMQQTHPSDYNTPEMIAAVENVITMFREYATVDSLGGSASTAENHFNSGNVAMYANGPWVIGDFSNPTKASEGFEEKVGVAVYPGSFVYDAPLQGYIITEKEDPKMIEACLAMVKFFTSADAQKLALDMQGMVPVYSGVEISDTARENFPLLTEFLEKANAAEIHTDNLETLMYTNMYEVTSQSLPLLVSGDMTAEEFCQALTEAAAKN